MANPTNAFGLRPVRYLSGASWTGACNPYYIGSADATVLFIGDPVTILGDANDAEVSAVGAGTFAAGMLAEIDITTLADGNQCTGIVVGVYPVNESSLPYKAASTEAIVMVCDDPNVVYQIRDDGVAALAAISIGLNALIIAGTGDTATGRSGMKLDTNGTAPTADASNMLTILNLSRIPDNELAANAVWDVRINQHTLMHGIVGV